MGNALLVLVVVELLVLIGGIILFVSPDTLDRLLGWPIRLLRRKKAEKDAKPRPLWRSILLRVIGLLLAVYAADDLRGLEIAWSTDKVSTAQNRAAMESALQREVDRIVDPLIASGKCVGLVVGIVDGDKTWVRGYGRSYTKDDAPPDENTIYEIGSVTKTFTAACFARMCSDGGLKPETPVQHLLPSSVRVPKYEGKEITLGNLADHTSGLPRVPSNMPLTALLGNPYESYDDAKLYEFLNGYKLPRSPGAQYEYSNLGMGLLGRVISRKQGLPYEQMVLKNICKPLGMADTVIALSDYQKKRLAPGYVEQMRMGKLSIAIPADNWIFSECTAGAGAIRSTAGDMLKYISANIGLIDTPLRSAIELTHKPRHTITDDFKIGMGWHMFGMGKKNDLVHWHNGETEGYKSFVGFCKGRKIGVVVLANSTPTEEEIDKTGLKIIKWMLGRS